jgi:hypothetical protein
VVRARPTDLVSVYRGTTTTDEGDVVDANDTAVHTGVPVSIAQSSRRSQPHNEQTPRLVRRYQGRAGITADIQRYDRLKDSGGRWYLVDADRAKHAVARLSAGPHVRSSKLR